MTSALWVSHKTSLKKLTSLKKALIQLLICYSKKWPRPYFYAKGEDCHICHCRRLSTLLAACQWAHLILVLSPTLWPHYKAAAFGPKLSALYAAKLILCAKTGVQLSRWGHGLIVHKFWAILLFKKFDSSSKPNKKCHLLTREKLLTRSCVLVVGKSKSLSDPSRSFTNETKSFFITLPGLAKIKRLKFDLNQ